MSPPPPAEVLAALPPGYRFVPKEKELVEHYLLPRALGRPSPFPGVGIIEDDTAGTTQPWKLFKRHSQSDDDQPYFYVRATDSRAGGRLVDGGFKWKSEKRVPASLRVGGEDIKWSKHILSLHLGDGGSLGWVMHEYTIVDPACPSVRICQISFTGHGHKRKRVPDGYEDDGCQPMPAPQRPRVAAPSPQETEQVETPNGDGDNWSSRSKRRRRSSRCRPSPLRTCSMDPRDAAACQLTWAAP